MTNAVANNKRLYVGNLPFSATDADLQAIFSDAGAVTSAKVVTDRDSGRSKGFGFVEMDTEETAQKAIEMFNGGEYEGRQIRVSVAQPVQDRPRGGGGGGGGRGGFGGNRGGGGGGGGRGRY